MCGCCGVGYWLVVLADERALPSSHQATLQAQSCQGLALASTNLPDTSALAAKKLVDPKAKPWDDDRVWGVFLRFFGRAS